MLTERHLHAPASPLSLPSGTLPMPFDSGEASRLSTAFREFCSDDLALADLRNLEFLLQQVLGIRNVRNVQLWTRRGAVQRDIINSRLGEYELDLRTWLAERIVIQAEPNFPTKQRVITPPFSESEINTFRRYANDNWIREYTTRIRFEDGSIVIEYSADSDNNPDELDLDSDEFADVVEE